MRRLLSFACEAAALGGSLDDAGGSTGLLIVTGGSQTRIGSHRMFERLAASLAGAGYPCFRFDRRGVGDSEGEDPGYKESGPDIAGAVRAFRAACPQLQRIVGFGLCDGGTALSLFGAQAGIDALLLVNPWFVEAETGAPPAAAIKQHYRDRLMSVEGWKKLLSGSVSYKKLFKGMLKIAAPPPADLADEVASALSAGSLPLTMVLARRDGTAIAAADVWNSPRYRSIRERNPEPVYIDSDSHTFARAGDEAALGDAVLAALRA
ncbi:MAG: hydrolase 1, exosortase A system-associated [Pseudomonadota bacterium]|nr:hydrolase 1, exosortase A system-associated [Pseudomonadota bacterium]